MSTHTKPMIWQRVKDGLLVILIMCLIAAGAHYWIADRRGFLRAIYPLEAELSVLTNECSDGAPEWMVTVLGQVTRLGGSPANQIAFSGPEGRLHTCRNGWVDTAFYTARVTAETRFRYASLTKVFTADAVLNLVARGDLRLDDRLIDLLPELPPLADPQLSRITIDHLLRHQAGFDRMMSEDVMFKHDHRPWCPYNLSRLSRVKLDFPPGERFSYSNRGYCLLGRIIEQVTGSSYRDYMNEQYELDALGIEFIDGPYLPDEPVYDFRNAGFYGPNYFRYFDFNALSSVAGLSGSAEALARATRDILSREHNLISAPVSDDCGVDHHEECFSYGLYPFSQKGRSRVYIHPGYLPGARSLIVVDETGGVLVILTSGSPATTEAAEKLIEQVYLARSTVVANGREIR